jgi:hypothetical protein
VASGAAEVVTGAEGAAVVAADSGLMLLRPAGPGKYCESALQASPSCRQPAAEEVMSQHTARPDHHGRPDDEEDAPYPQARRPETTRPRRPLGRPDGDDVGPDEPGEGEFELTGDDDLGEADLGPAAPDARDPDADSGRMRKITR